VAAESVVVPPDALASLRDELERLISPTDPESLWTAEKALARGIADGAFSAFANEIIAALAIDPTISPTPTSPLFRREAFRLAMLTIDEVLIEKHGPELPAHAQNMLLANLGPGPCEIHLYERENLDAVEVFEPGVRVVDRGVRCFRRGEILRVRAGADLFHIGKVDGPTVFAVLLGPVVFETAMVYGDDDLAARRQYAAKLTTTRAQTALAVLNELKPIVDDEVTDVMVSMLAHRAHVVRWAAANALSSLSETWRTFALNALQADRHPHIRNAVRRSLEADQRGA
jgi:hypothetical protein